VTRCPRTGLLFGAAAILLAGGPVACEEPVPAGWASDPKIHEDGRVGVYAAERIPILVGEL